MLRVAYIAASITVLFVLCLRWSRSKKVQMDGQGWSSITLGPMGYGSATGTAAFSLILFYVWLFVGSSRADPDKEMLYCLLTALASLTISLSILLSARWRRVQWRDGILRVTPILGDAAVYRFDELQSVAVRDRARDFVLHFGERRKLKISIAMTGLRELLLSLGNPPVSHI
jgi:hypothetical protein